MAISQSLGCQILSSYLYDAQKSLTPGGSSVGIWRDIDAYASAITRGNGGLTQEQKSFLRGRTMRRWITTGCNIPIFVAAHKHMSVKAIAPPCAPASFRWINIYDPDDVLGWPLQPLQGGYETLVEDRPIDAAEGAIEWILKSWNPMSHTAYWADKDVVGPLEQMLQEFL